MHISKSLSISLGLILCITSARGEVYFGVNQPFNGGFSSPSRSVARVYQSFLDDSLFTNLTAPTTVNGLSFRLPGVAGTTYPVGNLNFAQYDISIGLPSASAATAQTLTSTTFADNSTGDTALRTGALTIPAGSFTDNNTGIGDDTPNSGNAEFSFFIPFSTPYVLSPGTDYVLLIRHGGYTTDAPGGTETQWNFDALTYAAGSVVNTSGNVSSTTGASFGTINKYAFREVPEPSGVAILGLSGLAMLRRRRP